MITKGRSSVVVKVRESVAVVVPVTVFVRFMLMVVCSWMVLKTVMFVKMVEKMLE